MARRRNRRWKCVVRPEIGTAASRIRNTRWLLGILVFMPPFSDERVIDFANSDLPQALSASGERVGFSTEAIRRKGERKGLCLLGRWLTPQQRAQR